MPEKEAAMQKMAQTFVIFTLTKKKAKPYRI
jgi:hypothetical protein